MTPLMTTADDRSSFAALCCCAVVLIIGSFLLVLNVNGAKPRLFTFLKHQLEEPGARDDRANFRRLGDLGDHGAPPIPGALARALARHRSFAARLDRKEIAGVICGPPTAARNVVATDRWAWLGPRTISGRTRALAFDPFNPDRVWAGTAGGGLWSTVDGASSWTPTDLELGSLVVSTLVFDPAPPGTLYAGTGEAFQSGSFASQGAGLFRMVAGQLETSAQVAAPGLLPGDFTFINKLALIPDPVAHGNGRAALLVATETGLYRARDPGRSPWQRLISGRIADVVVVHGSPRRILAGGRSDGTVHVSTDGGDSFRSTLLPNAGPERVALAVARRDSRIVYAVTTSLAPQPTGLLLRSADGGATFAAQGVRDPQGRAVNFLPNGYYASAVWADDPEDENLVIVGGAELYRSTDGGATLNPVSSSNTQVLTGQSVHADIHAIVSHPNYGLGGNRRVLVGTDGGVYQTGDIRKAGADGPCLEGWSARNEGLGVVQIMGAAIVPGGQTIVAGTQDSGLLRYVAGSAAEPWSDLHRGGDGGVCAVDPHDPTVVYATLARLKILRSINGGASFDRIDGGPEKFTTGDQPKKPAPFSIDDTLQAGVNFFSVFVLDPHRPNRLFAGGLSLWKTDSARDPLTSSTGPRWEAIKPPIPPPTGVRVRYNAISALAVSEDDPNVIWVGYSHGDLFMTTDLDAPLSSRWSRMNPTGVESPTRMVTKIVIDDRGSSKRVYVSYGGYAAGNVRARGEGGAWTTLATNLPEVPARTLAIHPSRRDSLYVGTDLGLFCSEDRGASWFPTSEGPCQVQVADLVWSGQTLYAATHGRGLYRIDLREPFSIR